MRIIIIRLFIMKKNFIFLVVTTAFLFLSCEHQVFLPNPNIYPHDNDTDVSVDTSWHAPEELKATQGAKRSVTLTWKPVNDAIRYNVYRSDGQFGDFVQVGETKRSECEFVIKTDQPGLDMYYRITAVDNNGHESAMSNIERATTLARPVVNDIQGQQSFEDSNVYVSWYMSNAEAYADSVRYEVICFDESNKEVQRQLSSGLVTTVLFENLLPNTNYTYKVIAYDANNDYEESEQVDKRTARRLKPNPVENLEISKGASAKEIAVSFVLPDFVDVMAEKNVFEPTALYFNMYRRNFTEGENSEEFKLIQEGFGEYKSGNKVDYSKVDFGKGPVDYKPGDIVTFVDKDSSLERGKKYEYKVQSFAYTSRKISSDDSVAVNNGWLLPDFKFETQNLDYKFNADKTKKESAILKFNFSMETFGIPYKYKITEIKRPLSGGGKGSSVDLDFGNGTEATSVEQIVNYERHFDDLKKDSGYYSYKITVLSADGKPLDSYQAIGESLVTDSMDIPKIGDIKVISGYEDRIELEWVWNPAYKYTLTYRDPEDTENTIIAHDDIVSNKDSTTLDQAQSKVIYKDMSAKAGVERTYQLYIESKGFNIPSEKMVGMIPEKTKVVPKYCYDKVSVSIVDIPANAANYKVTAIFENPSMNQQYKIEKIDNSSALCFEYKVVKNGVKPVSVINLSDTGDKVKVTVEETRKLSIKTYKEGEKTPNVSEGGIQSLSSEFIVAPVGQKYMTTEASKATSPNTISVKWNSVPGAEQYVVFRDRNRIGSDGKLLPQNSSKPEKYIVKKASNGVWQIVSEDIEIPSNENAVDYVSVSFDTSSNLFTLSDKYRPMAASETGSPWVTGQAELRWGAPYKYTVVPVVSGDDAAICSKDGDVISINSLKFNNSKNDIGGTLGFGWNVTASKGDYFGVNDIDLSGNKINNGIKITWNKQYFGESPKYTIFRRVKGSDSWKQLNTHPNVTEYVDTDISQGELYEYAVVNADYRENSPDIKFIENQKQIKDGKQQQCSMGFMLPKPTISNVVDKNDGTEEVTFDAVAVDGIINNMFDGYVIQVRNNNIDDKWHDIKEIPITGENKEYNVFTNVVDNTSGLLKVLRDYKHYFRICVYKDSDSGRVYSAADKNFQNDMNNDYVKWGTRQITIDEFAKAAIIGMSTGMEKERGNRGSNNDGDGITGLKSTSSYNAAIWDTDFTLTFNYKDYVANHKSKGIPEDVNAVAINGTLYARGGLLNAWQKHYWTSSSIVVTYKGNNRTGSIIFNGESKKTGSVNRSEGVIEVTWGGVTKSYDMGNNSGNAIKPLPFPCGEGYLNNSSEWQ